MSQSPLPYPTKYTLGFYECQVASLGPKISRLVYMNVVQARSHIGDNPRAPVYLRLNDRLNLTCQIEAPEQPDYVYWYKNDQVSPALYCTQESAPPSTSLAV